MGEPWDKFLKGELIETEVTPVIYRSWQRSLNYNVNHSRISQNMILSAPHLRELRDSQEDLIRAAEPILPYIFQLLVSSNYTVLLTDKKGFILEAKGDGPFVNKAERIHLSPGVNWREDVKGTNAIGTALTENIPIAINGWEHYVKENHFLTCCAAPITGIQGDPLGIFDISGELGNSKERILEIAMLGAKMIEQNLRALDLKRQLSFSQQGAKLAIELLQEGFISIDYSGLITDINPTGAFLLGRKREEVIGKLVKEVFSTPKGWSLNPTQLDLQLKTSAGHEIISKLKPITDEAGRSLGAIGTVQLNFDPERFAVGWVGSGSSSRQILEKAQKAALTPSSILLQGESGTGKEIIARMIHNQSPHRQGPFVAVNCAALPSSLLESELFGYSDGAFTGARRGGQLGKFELAHQGTLFLDEIGDMPLNAQAAVLRVLQEKEVTRIGDSKPHKIDVRVIVASHKDLKAMVENQTFRLDLYYRLKVISIELSPLRERLEDLHELVPFFIQKSCAALGCPLLGFDENIYPYLLAHSWPGNVRELENCIEGMVALANTPTLSISDLPQELKTPSSTEPGPEGSHALLFQQTRQTIIDALVQTHGKIAPAARILGIGRNTLYRKIKEMNIHMD